MIILLAPLMLISPIVGFPVAFYMAGKPEKFRYSIIIALSLFFALLGFYFIPQNVHSDLAGYFVNYVDTFRGQQFSAFFQRENTTDKFFIVQNLLFFVSSRFSTDQVLPFITMFFVYFNGFDIITDFARSKKLKPAVVWQFLLLFIVTITFTTVVNNIRNILGVSFFCLALYRDLYKGKHSLLTFILYFIGMSTHIAIVGLVLIRIIVALLVYLKKLNVFRIIVIAVFLIVVLVVLVKTGVYTAFVEKGISYLHGGEAGSALATWFEAADNSGLLTLTKVVGAISSVFFAFISIRKLSQDDTKTSQFDLFLLIISMIVIVGAFFPGTTWQRFYFVTYFFVPIFFYYSLQIKSVQIRALVLLYWLIFGLWNVIFQLITLAQQVDIATFVKSVLVLPLRGFIGI